MEAHSGSSYNDDGRYVMHMDGDGISVRVPHILLLKKHDHRLRNDDISTGQRLSEAVCDVHADPRQRDGARRLWHNERWW